MKRRFIAALSCLLFSLAGQAQNYYHGTWYVTAKGMPNGDVNMMMTVDCNANPAIGNITDPSNPAKLIKLENVKISGDSFSAQFKGFGITLPLELTKVDERTAAGKAMRRFDLTASKDKTFDLVIPNADEDTQSALDTLSLTVTVDVKQELGPMPKLHGYNNMTDFSLEGDGDFLERNGLHATVTRVWAGPGYVQEKGWIEGSKMSDYLLVAYDYTNPRRAKLVKMELKKLKQKYPKLRYIEVGNEFDYDQGKGHTAQSYYTVYKSMYQIVNEINAELKPETPLEVGGPTSSNYNLPWITALLDAYAADTDPAKKLDFISYHGYFLMPDGVHREFYKENPSLVCGQREHITQLLVERGLPADTPVFISELGIYPGPLADDFNDMGKDQLRQASGMASLLYWYTRTENTYPFNWVTRHPQESRKDQLVSRSNDGQVINAPEKFTPYGNALVMLSKLQGTQVSASTSVENGKGIYSLASVGNGKTVVMVWNFQGVDRHGYELSIDLPGSAIGGKTVTEYHIDARTCNHNADFDNCNLHPVAYGKAAGEKLGVFLQPNALHLFVIE